MHTIDLDHGLRLWAFHVTCDSSGHLNYLLWDGYYLIHVNDQDIDCSPPVITETDP